MNKPRLIDANELKKQYTQSFVNAFGVEAAAMFVGIIDQMPTAYDVQGVVEQLEHDIEDLSGLELMSGKFAEGYAWATKNHIEIVKGGMNNE